MNIRSLGKVAALCTLSALSFATTGEELTNDVISAVATLKDGSSVKGILIDEVFSVSSVFDNELRFASDIVKTIVFEGTSTCARVTLINGDKLTVDFKTDKFEIASMIGNLTIKRDQMRSLSLSHRKSIGATDLSEGEYCVIDIQDGCDADSFPVWYTDTLPEGDEYKTTSIVLKKIPAGSFSMCNQCTVKISKPFYIGVYELTRRQMQLLAPRSSWMQKYGQGDPISDHPANMVTFNVLRGTNLGCRWPQSDEVDPDSVIGVLREKTGLKIDLPTEAQWEYACRAGTTSLYNNGGNSSVDLGKLGRYRGSGSGLARVGSYEPNAWGLYDMHGNVFEWCLDWGPWPLRDCTDPKGSPSGANRCLRGGSVDYRADECTADFRYYAYGYPSNESGYFGARITCPAE